MHESVVAIIPARSGSKGIRDKNIASLRGYPLLAYSIIAARMSKRIARVLLSTDSDRYAELGKRYGAEASFLRPADLSTDGSTDREFMLHAMEWVRDHEGRVPEFWVHLRPTTPLRDPAHLDEAVTMLEQRAEATALRSAHPAPESPFKWFRRNDQGYLTGLTTDDTSLDRFNNPRQSFPTAFIPDGYVDIVRSSLVMNTPLFHGDRVLGYESPHCTEVDSVQELEYLDFELGRNWSPLLDHLKRNYKS